MENVTELLETRAPALGSEKLNWESLVTAWKASGLTREEFCQRHQLNYRQFLYQRTRLSQRKTLASPWAPVKQAGQKPPLPLMPPCVTESAFLLRSPRGHQLSIPLNAETSTLKMLLIFMGEN